MLGALRREGRWRGTLETLQRDGGTFWSVVTIVRVTDEALRPVMMLVYADDAGRSDEQAQVRAERDRLQASLDAAPVALLTLDAQPRMRSANQAFHHLAGRHPGALVGLPLADLLHPEDVAADVVGARRAASLDGAGPTRRPGRPRQRRRAAGLLPTSAPVPAAAADAGATVAVVTPVVVPAYP